MGRGLSVYLDDDVIMIIEKLSEKQKRSFSSTLNLILKNFINNKQDDNL